MIPFLKWATPHAIEACLGIFIAIGAGVVTGNGILGAVVGFGAFLFVGVRDQMKAETEKQQAVAEARKKIYDCVVDHGVKMRIDDKQWAKGCRIDPETGAVIEAAG